MASPFVTAALPVVVARAFPWPEGQARRVAIAAAMCGVAPDLDLLVHGTGAFAHKGFFHSFFVAAILAVLVGSAAFRSLRVGSRPWWSVVTFLFGAAAWHGVLDAMTASDVGVALFAPFDPGRHTLAFAILPSCQAGLDAYLGLWGLLTIANEALYVLVPAWLLVALVRARFERERLAWEAVAWVAAVVALRVAWPEGFVARRARIIERVGTPDAGDPEEIPHADLPGEHLLTTFEEMRGLGLLDRPLEAVAPSPPTTANARHIGRSCDHVSFDPGATCSVSPAIVVMTIVNRLGVAREPFAVDPIVSVAEEHEDVLAAEVRVRRGPYPPAGAPIDPVILPAVASLVDVDIVLPTRRYAATLALDATTALIGGRWTGDPPDGPDSIVVCDGRCR